MTHVHRTFGAQGRPLSFPVAGWIMLVVIMIFAAAAGGQSHPQLRLNGSAFDPSSSTVALKSAKPRPAAKLAPLRNDLPDLSVVNSSISAGLAIFPVSAVWRAIPNASERFERSVALQPLSRHVSSLGARAPPPN